MSEMGKRSSSEQLSEVEAPVCELRPDKPDFIALRQKGLGMI